MYKGSMSHLGMRGGFTSIAFYCLTSRCQPWNRCSAALTVKEERGSSREESISPLQDGFFGVQCNHLALSHHLQLKLLEEVLFISIIIFDTYILAADTYYCLSPPSYTIPDGSVWVSSCASSKAWTWLHCRPGAPGSSTQAASCKTSPSQIVTALQSMLFRRAE